MYQRKKKPTPEHQEVLTQLSASCESPQRALEARAALEELGLGSCTNLKLNSVILAHANLSHADFTNANLRAGS